MGLSFFVVFCNKIIFMVVQATLFSFKMSVTKNFMPSKSLFCKQKKNVGSQQKQENKISIGWYVEKICI